MRLNMPRRPTYLPAGHFEPSSSLFGVNGVWMSVSSILRLIERTTDCVSFSVDESDRFLDATWPLGVRQVDPARAVGGRPGEQF